MKVLKHILLMLLMFCTVVDAAAQKRSKLVIARNHLKLLIDLSSAKAEIDSLLKAAGTGLTADMVLKGRFSTAINNGWNVKAKKNIIQLDRSLSDLSQTTPYLISTPIKGNARPGYPADVQYGLNSFSRVSVHELPSGITRFFVPGNLQVRRVLLSGNFNNWSTIKGLMNKTDSGWVADVRLEPGKYAYKFIIGSNWSVDANNNLFEDDGTGNSNSIYFRYNYTFRLTGYQSAGKVSVAGSFNKWNANQLIMHRSNGAWETSMYLHDGIYLYRYLVDGKWLTDPANLKKQLQDNIPSSVLLFGETVTFKLNGYTNAHKVFVAGSFNNWDKDMLSLTKTTTGWMLPYTLSAGNYTYKFIVDGQWVSDPVNPHNTTIDGKINSFLAVRANYTFHLKGYANAKTIRLAGTFNNWNEQGYTLAHQGDEWVISMRLKPGKYLYKFLVDGNWIIDPGNKLWEQNEFNTGNSVLWIE